MKRKEMDSKQLFELLLKRYPQLESCKDSILDAYHALKNAYEKEGKLLVAGNGGSASDSEHIVGELMKSFMFERKIQKKYADELVRLYGDEGVALSKKLEGTLCSIPLTSMPALSTAFINDVDPALTFAQMLTDMEEKVTASSESAHLEIPRISFTRCRLQKQRELLPLALREKAVGK